MMKGAQLTECLYELIKLTATELPEDVKAALIRMKEREDRDSHGAFILSLFLENIDLASQRKAPLCQDTGMPTFYFFHPPRMPHKSLRASAEKALVTATNEGYLRPNAVHPVTGKNSGNNIGINFPSLYFHEWDDEAVEVSLLLKGGGSENVGTQYSLPHDPLEAGRDMEGVRRVILEAVRRAEGKGCPPGVLGICLGGDRASGYAEAKRQLLRPLDDRNTDPFLAEWEERLLRETNSLGIGPLGLGGKATLMGVKIGTLHRLPACYFVTVTYMCWVYRRRTIRIEKDGTYHIIL